MTSYVRSQVFGEGGGWRWALLSIFSYPCLILCLSFFVPHFPFFINRLSFWYQPIFGSQSLFLSLSLSFSLSLSYSHSSIFSFAQSSVLYIICSVFLICSILSPIICFVLSLIIILSLFLFLSVLSLSLVFLFLWHPLCSVLHFSVHLYLFVS